MTARIAVLWLLLAALVIIAWQSGAGARRRFLRWRRAWDEVEEAMG